MFEVGQGRAAGGKSKIGGEAFFSLRSPAEVSPEPDIKKEKQIKRKKESQHGLETLPKV